MGKCMCVCVHVHNTASLHISICNYSKLPNIGLNKVDTRRRQLINNLGFFLKTVYFVVFNICETLRFILLLASHLLLDFHSCLFLSAFPTKDTTASIFVI